MRRGYLFLGMLTASASLPVLPAQAAAPAASQVQVASAVHHDVSPPLASLQPKLPAAAPPHAIPLRALSSKGLTTAPADPGLQSSNPATATPSTSSSFDGVGVGFTGFTVNSAPPDPNGAVGATQYVQWVNESFAVFNKATGAVVRGPMTGNTLWTGFGGPCETDNDGDPIAQYDKAANRWVMSQFAVTGGPPYYQCFAVSTTPDATGTYNRYSFQFSMFPDYPKIGVWPDAYYVSFNMFQSATGPEVGGDGCAFDRISMLAGTAATMQCNLLSTTYDGLLPADLDGATPPPAGSPGYFLDYGTNSLNLFSFHVDWAKPSNSAFSAPTSIPVTAFSPTCGGGTCIPQTGTRQQLDSLADRLMYRLAYRNFGDHESLVVNHSVVANGTSGIRWYEIRSPRSSPAIYQSGTYAPNDGNWRWMGSIAMDAVGDMAMGYSVSSGLIHPSISYTGRIPSDPAGIMEAEASLIAGAGSQTQTLNRWGDYTSMSVDPVDDCTYWYTDQYLKANGTFNWSTRIGNFRFPGCVAVPTGLAASAVSSSRINLSWAAVQGATSYKIQRSLDGSTGWTQVGTSTLTSFTDTGLSPSTLYFYRVVASNISGDSVPSSVASATTTVGLAYSQSPQGNWVGTFGADGYVLAAWNDQSDLVSMPLSSLVLDQGGRYLWTSSTTAAQALQSPDASTRRAACFASSGSQIRLHLTFPNSYSGTVHLYAVDWEPDFRRETITINDGSGPRTADISSDFSQGAWVNAPVNVSAGGSITISVTVTSGPNAVLSGIFLGGLAPAPAAPVGLNASPASSSRVSLSWTASAAATSYKIQRSLDGSTGWTQVGTSTTTSFTDTGLSPSTLYFYRVVASNVAGDSVPSNVASATTSVGLAYGQSPQGNWVGTFGADGYALAAWNDQSDLVSMPFSSLVLDQGGRYLWTSSTTAAQALQSPDASTRRAACFASSGTQIRLHLSFPNSYSGTVHLYAVDWEPDFRRETITINDGSGPRTADISSDFSQGAWVSAPINVSAGGSVTISVTVTSGPNAVLSGIFLGGPAPVPTAPTSLNASPASSSRVGLSWTASTGATSYKIQRSLDGSTGWTLVGTSNTTSFTDTGLSPSTLYFYRIVASNVAGDSVPSNVASATTSVGLAYSQSPQGNWVGTFGADGYALAAWNDQSDLVSMPFSSLVLDQGGRYLWTSSTTAAQALQSPDASTRRAACFASSGSQIRLHLTFPNSYSGTVHLYAVDWEPDLRRQTITVNDGSGPRTADISSDFSQGAWVNAPINVSAGGSVTISVTVTSGPNAVLSGIFLG